jgi:hypothetical protein
MLAELQERSFSAVQVPEGDIFDTESSDIIVD